MSVDIDELKLEITNSGRVIEGKQGLKFVKLTGDEAKYLIERKDDFFNKLAEGYVKYGQLTLGQFVYLHQAFRDSKVEGGRIEQVVEELGWKQGDKIETAVTIEEFFEKKYVMNIRGKDLPQHYYNMVCRGPHECKIIARVSLKKFQANEEALIPGEIVRIKAKIKSVLPSIIFINYVIFI